MVRQKGGQPDTNLPMLKGETKLNYSTLRAVVFFFCVVSSFAAIPASALYLIPFCTLSMFIVTVMTYAYNEKLAAFASLGALGILVWYVVIMVTNRNSLSKMPETWNTYNGIIAGLVALHFLFIAIGKALYTLTWVTMAGLAAMMTLQHVTINNFKTNG